MRTDGGKQTIFEVFRGVMAIRNSMTARTMEMMKVQSL